MMDSRNVKALKSGIWYTIANFIVKGAGFITTPIFTRLLSAEDVGAFSNINAWFSILVIITTFDLYSSVAVARFDYKDRLDEYIASVLVLGTSITMVFYVLVIIFKDFVTNLLSINFYSLNLIFIYCMVYPALQMFQMKSQILYRYKLSTFLSLTSVLSSVFASLLLVLVSSNRLFGRVTGYYIPLIIINIIIYIIILYHGKRIGTQYWKYALKISFPLIWHTLAGNLLASSDRIMITKYCGTSDNALYSVAYSCAFIVSVLWSSMNTAWSPWAYEKMDEKDYSTLKNFSKPYSVFFGFVVFCFMLISPEVLLLMGGNAYLSAISVIPPVMVGYVFQFVYSLYVNIEFYHKKQIWIAVGTIISATINICLNNLLIPRFGFIVAAYTTLIAYIMLFLIHYYIVSKMKKTYWYDSKFNMLFLLFFISQIPIMYFLYTNFIIRYTIICIIIFALFFLIFLSRKALIASIKTKSITYFFDYIKETTNKRRLK